MKRAAIFADDATRAPIDFHDLRWTGLTWIAVRGDEPVKIQERARHKNYSTTQARSALPRKSGTTSGPFPALRAGLVRPAIGPSPVGHSWKVSPFPYVSLRPQRDLNPCSRRERPVS